MTYTHDQIISALTIIKNVCDENTCDLCPLRKGGGCHVADNGSPNLWKLNEKDNWRAFND